MPYRKIPSSTISRLSVYHRALATLTNSWVVSSGELSQLTGFTAAQIRRDLTYFGQFGTPGRGYVAAELRQRIEHILGIDREWNVALVGVGHLGSALLAYQGFRERGFNVVAAFDSDPAIIGSNLGEVTVRDIARLPEAVPAEEINMAIVAVPASAARGVLEMLAEAGVKAVLNFAPVRLAAPEGMHLVNVDLAAELERLSFFMGSGAQG